MDLYHIWCDLKPGVRDLEFSDALRAWMEHLRNAGHIADYRLTRRKLGLGPPGLGDFHVLVETENLAQLDAAFNTAAARSGETERLHGAVYSSVQNLTFALYRDFPDPVREGK